MPIGSVTSCGNGAVSPALDRGILGPLSTPAGATAEHLLVKGQFTEPMGIAVRPVWGGALDLGAFEGR